MIDALSNADPLDGVCAIASINGDSVILCHTLVGLASDANGTSVDHNGVGLVRIDDRLRGPEHTNNVLHEVLHRRFPHWTEAAVEQLADDLSSILHLPEIKRRSFS